MSTDRYDDDVEEIEEVEAVEVEEYDDEDGEYVDSKASGGRRNFFAQLKGRISGEPIRPGEHDVIRSPFVLTLVGGAVVLSLLALIFWLMIARESAQRRFDAAEAEMEQGKYAQAIQLYTKFLEVYPDHELTDPALLNLMLCRVMKETSGAQPNVVEGLKQLETLIEKRRDTKEFKDLHDEIRGFARTITISGATQAESQKNQEFLDASEAGELLMDRYTDPEAGPDEKLKADILEMQRNAEKAILKATVFAAEIAAINKLIEDKKPIEALHARRALIERYEVFRDDREIQRLLEKILETEKTIVKADNSARDAKTDDHPVARAPLTLTRHTRAGTTEVSNNESVFGVAADCIYGVDTVTGDPLWRRVIGLGTPFFPRDVDAAVPSILLFDTNHDELVLIERATGKLVWRQPLDGDIPQAPLIHEGQIYLPSRNQKLYTIGLTTGRLTSVLTFSQGLIGPPALTADNKNLVLPGEQEVVYTVSLRPLQCTDVAWLDFHSGTIHAPMIRMGRLVLLIENHETDYAMLRVLRGNEDGTDLQEIAVERVDGPVYDPAILRGRNLFVASQPQRITAFTISDDPDQEPIALIASQQLKDTEAARMFMYLSAGPGGQLWLASKALRRFSLRSSTLVVDSEPVAEGIHLQPPQLMGQRYFLGRREPYANSVYFSQTDRQTMTGLWRLVLGTQVLATSAPTPDAVVSVTDTAEIFRVNLDEIGNGGFRETETARVRLPEDLSDPIGATALTDGSIAVYCGGLEPGLWLVNRAGQVAGRRWTLPSAPEAAPVQIDAGIVVPIAGALKLSGRQPNSRRVDDYRSPQVQGETARWKSLTRIDGTQVIALDTQNRLIRAQYRDQPTPHLAEVGIINLDSPIDIAPTVQNGYLIMTDVGGRLAVADAQSLEPLAEARLPAPATSQPWAVGERVFVEVSEKDVLCFSLDKQFMKLGQFSTDGARLRGAPLPFGDGYLVALSDGVIVITDESGNDTGQRLPVGQALKSGPLKVGDAIIVTSVDGSFHRIDALLEQVQ